MMPIRIILTSGYIATLFAFLVSVIIVKSQGWHGRHTLDHDLNSVQKFHIVAVPRVGGVAVFLGILSGLVFLMLSGLLTAPGVHVVDCLKVLFAALPIFLAGTLEDLTKSVGVKWRLAASVVSALLASFLVGAVLSRINIWGVDALFTLLPFAVAVTALVVAGGINAINIIDGFHGIAASAALIMLGGLSVLAWRAGDSFVTLLAVLGVGAALGFLLVNYPRGRLFAGDGGAYLLGFWVSEVAVLLLVRNAHVNAWQVLAICAYPIIEVGYSIYRRKIVRKSSPGSPDGLHMHTLIYRRFICRKLPHTQFQPWQRNARVAYFTSGWILSAALLAVLFGESVLIAISLVLVQIAAYLKLYAKLVRFGMRSGPKPRIDVDIAGVRLPDDVCGSINKDASARATDQTKQRFRPLEQ